MILVEGLVEPGTQGASLQGLVGLLPKLLAWPPPESHGSEGQWGSSSHLHFAHLPGSRQGKTRAAVPPLALLGPQSLITPLLFLGPHCTHLCNGDCWV